MLAEEPYGDEWCEDRLVEALVLRGWVQRGPNEYCPDCVASKFNPAES